ncbi:hypothetical protein [Demequina flava]|uniref:hypothetical protein n=1 Tax=Demequina flava TaxID=1095025 RepID=UPI000AD3131A|nr:hypothetical protein [Demequina flava]
MSDLPPPSQPPSQPPYGGQPPYGSAPPPGGFGGASEEKNSLGTWALVLGILSFVCCGVIAAIIAIVVGKQSMTAAEQGLATNGTLGKVGWILGWVNVALTIVAVVIYGILFATGTFTLDDFSY